MKAITVYGPRDARLESVPTPPATGDMVLIKVKRTGVCATDLSIFTGESSFIRSGEIKFPCRFGHEYAGVVEAVGPEVKNFKPGDRVYSDNFATCGTCEACLRGDYMSCPTIWSVGTVNCWDGCYAEYMQMPERHVHHLPDVLSMDEGAPYLGECALVPYSSPIRKCGILFYNTLFDENAACHLALGMGFTNTLKDYEKYTEDECHARGINDSIVHEDFMIGTPDLSITAKTRDGKEIAIFRDGEWAL